MDTSSPNIFASTSQESTLTLQAYADYLQQFAQSMIDRINSIVSSITLSKQTTDKISENLAKTKEVIKQNKELIIGISVIGLLYIVKQRNSDKHRHNKSKHIHSLTSNPNSPSRRSGVSKRDDLNQDNSREKRQVSLRSQSKKSSDLKLGYSRDFISQCDQEEYIRSDQEDKDNPDLSTSTRRTESMVSDIEPLKKKKRKSLQPILDLVQEEDQTQDRVFFQMFRTYRDS